MDSEEEESVNLDDEESDDWTDADSNRDAIGDENAMDEEAQQYDITLTASHSYMGSSLHEMSGRVVLEPGWRGCVPVLGHHAVVFPGEIVPLLLTDDHDSQLLAQTMQKDKLFALLCPDETGAYMSGYGVLCEVYEAALRGAGAGAGLEACKARALHRVLVTDRRLRALPMALFSRARLADVQVLGEIPPAHPLRRVRLAALDGRRELASPNVRRAVSRLDAALTAWPPFVHELLDYRRLRDRFREHFAAMGAGSTPSAATSVPRASTACAGTRCSPGTPHRPPSRTREAAAPGPQDCEGCVHRTHYGMESDQISMKPYLTMRVTILHCCCLYKYYIYL